MDMKLVMIPEEASLVQVQSTRDKYCIQLQYRSLPACASYWNIDYSFISVTAKSCHTSIKPYQQYTNTSHGTKFWFFSYAVLSEERNAMKDNC